MNKIDIARDVALKTLYEINENGAYSNISLNQNLERYELREIDRAFVTELVYGTIKWRLTIDWIIEQFSSVKIKKISPWILNILRLGVYQLLYTDRIPESAACNESVNLAKRYGHNASTNYVNAVLRNISRNKKSIKYPERDTGDTRYLSIKYSHPEWMISEWIKLYGFEFTEALLKKNNEVPDFTIRVNTLKMSKNQLIDTLREQGINAENGKYIDEAVVIRNPSSISRLEAFKQGCFQVQDESSMLVAVILDPAPGELVMDVCSAPGGKATHIAQLMKNRGTVVARDIHRHKIKLIDDAAQRLGLDIIKTEFFDAAIVDEGYIDTADRVLVDAPCTGLGIIRRKPDIKWEKASTDKNEIVNLQTRILNTASRYVKPGGVLVYSTCTITPDENENVVKNFIDSNGEFSLADFASLLPQKLIKPDSGRGCIQFFPNVDDIDGFFIAKMIRKG